MQIRNRNGMIHTATTPPAMTTADLDDLDLIDDPGDDDDSDSYPDWYDHPSLSASERNSLMGAR